ncbi:Sec-independent protein translocase protein TatB [Gilvimarinus sp. DA14]|uniref:Sec-independent protein translocase protein TatB n=1 Tax=Gilvimarinus sp. DA14 TaxID=2956798 RepID=UPI0020B81305|nr:Sec-independent protein translocase protein TatB [Gilvimarinus sp. DA14]UTF59538.1 Sec-independent protein translocase protein TatB [Gilvimarinus sp. DA14]
MFDIGFFELLVIAIVSLVIIGPERLPETVRSVSLWIGRLKRSLRETRSEIEKQIGADDIRRQLHNEEIMRNLEATRRDIEEAVDPERTKRMHGHYGPPPEEPMHAHGEASDKTEPRKADDADKS